MVMPLKNPPRGESPNPLSMLSRDKLAGASCGGAQLVEPWRSEGKEPLVQVHHLELREVLIRHIQALELEAEAMKKDGLGGFAERVRLLIKDMEIAGEDE